ncbi:hypothetical protein ANCCEY_08299 [Ancylostoma ceylanicum]|uniref:Uncharacterized protein n=1 Tax=Ancylostoma ceylanicum TaxID=53326 RepID=A0A0D6LKV6_9BILA|nr:hypothetical protein ANCCEY_08299 [Ancylostoma ceylanicum]
MRVAKKVQLRRDSVASKRYCLCYSIRLKTNCGLELVGKKVGSTPPIRYSVTCRLYRNGRCLGDEISGNS